MAPKTQAPAAPQPGQLFGLPGLTQWTEQFENNDKQTVTLSQTATAPFSAVVPFKNTDVTFWWEMDFVWTNTATAGSGKTITTSQYFPYNVMGASKVQIQNVYPAFDCQSGIDAYLWQIIRPMIRPDYKNELEASVPATWAGLTTALESNLVNSGTNQSSTATSVNFTLQIPASIMFDYYYDLDKDGTIRSAPHRTIVSPQYMSGTARDVQPQIQFNPGFGATSDQGPFTIASSDVTSTYAGSVKMGWRRYGIYGNQDVSKLPVVYNWQYLRQARQISIAGVTQKDIPIPPYGQILSVLFRLYDPAANSGAGGAIALSNMTVCRLIFGSGLLRYDDTPKTMQQRLIRQHGVLFPVGCGGWDIGVDEYGRVTNQQALNTLSTAGCTVHLEFTSAVSSSAYAVMLVEALTYVA